MTRRRDRRAYAAAYYRANRDAVREKQWRDHIKREFGITPKQYEEIMRWQLNVCAICGYTERCAGRDRLAVDHDHATGRIRGLLCTNCNRILGLAEDSAERLYAAIDYLHNAEPRTRLALTPSITLEPDQ
jgi:hypothetical protein